MPTIHKLTKVPEKEENKEQNGRTHVQEDKWTTQKADQKGETQREHQVLEPPPVEKAYQIMKWKDLLKDHA